MEPYHRIRLFALIVSTLVPLHAFAADAIDIGAPGATGASGIRGKPGGNGADAQANLDGSDLTNTAQTTGGAGGNGGASIPLLPGGRGGNGGNAKAHLQSGGQQLPENSDAQLSATVRAQGGDGGNGGSGLIRGAGGTGGDAAAVGIDVSTTSGFDTLATSLLQVEAGGGHGGSGLSGGAGGKAVASGQQGAGATASRNTATVRATGGNGGNAALQGGHGGGANAKADLTVAYDANPSDARATATGGNGGTSAIGLNGNGGDARAIADASSSRGNLETAVFANAAGGASGTHRGPLAAGIGGDAVATALNAGAQLPTFADATSTARGGNGVARGGDALAEADTNSFLSTEIHATAIAGAGAGSEAALAVARGVSLHEGGSAWARASTADDFARDVNVKARTFNRGGGGSTYALASIGDTGRLQPAISGPVEGTTIRMQASAPTQEQTANALAGQSNLSDFFANGPVWGLGEIATIDRARADDDMYIRNDGDMSYTFDGSAITSAGHLWLGLLDSNLANDSIGDFGFSITSGNTVLFEHDFTGSEFLDYFDDRLFDLGDWSSLLGSDNLLHLGVVFTGYVPEIQFAFGQEGAQASVPEPPSLALLLAGLSGLLAIKHRSRR